MMTDFDDFFQDLSSPIRQYVQMIFSDQDIATFVYAYAFFLAFVVILLLYWIIQPLLIGHRIRKLASHTETLTPRQFHKIKSAPGATKHDFPGVYILHNLDKDMYYVGQGKRVMQRVGNHFAGRGNGDVYADYKYGDRFSIQIISLRKSGCHSLNELERKTIRAYHAYTRGYNKTRGNKG